MIYELNEPQAIYAVTPKQKEADLEPVEKRVSLDEYLEMIADGTRRLEYHDGEVVDIQSATEQHGLICTNLTGLIFICNRNKKCKVYAGDRELWIEKCRKMFYPDHVIVCGDHEMKQMSKNVKATVNPSIVIEVLSDSTEGYDLTTKMRCYKTLTSLKQIIFVAQSEKYILSLIRSEEYDRVWNDIEYFEDEETIPIGDCLMQLKDVYDQVEFENKPERVSDV
jgi:Uma2 family endonuclease